MMLTTNQAVESSSPSGGALFSMGNSQLLTLLPVVYGKPGMCHRKGPSLGRRRLKATEAGKAWNFCRFQAGRHFEATWSLGSEGRSWASPCTGQFKG